LNPDERRAALQAAFTPARPVQNTDLFAGRVEQLSRVIDTFHSPGEHAAIFGERGVGKTSLAAIADTAASLSGRFPIRLNCQANDDAPDVWRRIGETIDRRLRVDEAGDGVLVGVRDVAAGAVAILTGPSPSSHDVLTGLEVLTQARPVVVFLDEFDRLGESRIHNSLVDLMKTVADVGIDVTFIVVGVAATVDGLIDEHESIGRGLNQIEMPRMSTAELLDILDRGLSQAEMGVEDDAARFVAKLSMGLPHYVHLMGLHSGLTAVAEGVDIVSVEDVIAALPAALARAEQHVSRLYYDATHSTRANLFQEVLLAAALADADDRGYFAPGDLRGPLAAILGRPLEIPAFARHLNQFTDERGPVLEKSTHQSRPRYRFSEPLLVPYVAMKGVSDELIEADRLRTLL
jgi:hypothetical protein